MLSKNSKISAIRLKGRGKYCFFLKENGKHLGSAIRSDDGYYYYDPEELDGLWSPYSLRCMADKLDDLNRPWDDKVNEYFDSQSKTE